MKTRTTSMNLFIVSLISIFLCACQPEHEGGVYEHNSGFDSNTDSPTSGGNGDIVVLEKTRTAAVIRGTRYLSTLVSCLGTRTASPKAKEVWLENRGSLSENGSANSITAPMLTAMSKISAEVCNDLINQERGLASTDRRIFNQINFEAGPSAINVNQVRDSVRRLARSCWGRNETPDELAVVESANMAAFSNSQNGAQETIDQMVFLCSAMTSSFSTFEM